MTNGCSTPEGVIVSIARCGCRAGPSNRLLNARGRHRLDRGRRPAGPRCRPWLLNARGRHRLDRARHSFWVSTPFLCSTPEGVIVSIAQPGPGSGHPVRLLNARGRHRLDRLPTAGQVEAGVTAQRPRASSSRSRSTRDSGGCRRPAAQRPRASSSRSRQYRRRDRRRRQLLNARGRHRLDRSISWPGLGRSTGCSTPEGVIVSIALLERSPAALGFTAQRPRASSSRSRPTIDPAIRDAIAAQRPRASSSRSRDSTGITLPTRPCSTPEGVIVSIAFEPMVSTSSPQTAQRPRASSSRSRARGLRGPGFMLAAQRPRASSSRSPPGPS